MLIYDLITDIQLRYSILHKYLNDELSNDTYSAHSDSYLRTIPKPDIYLTVLYNVPSNTVVF